MDASDKSVLTWTPSFVLSTLCLLCGIGLTFAQVIFADFVWDDKNLILNNPWLSALCLFFALCAKESAIIGPVLLYLCTPQKSRLHHLAPWLLSPLLLWLALRYHAIGFI